MKSYSDYIVDTKILKENVANIKKNIGNSKFCAVVKANAYGMGMKTICKALYGEADFFACACLKEALHIRLFDKKTKILILGYISDDDLEIVSKNNISISVGSYEQLLNISEKVNQPLNVHLQVNTGLNRFGFRSLALFKKGIAAIRSNSKLKLEGVYSHFATKEKDVAFINKQYFRFLQFKKFVVEEGVLFHLSNSFATIHSKKFHLDMVRNGFLTYGFLENLFGNKPIVSIKSHIISVENVKRGDTIGYDRTFKASKSLRVAIIPLGYADGLNRRLSNNFSVIICGVRCRVIGLICMDVFMVDVSNINARVGDEVVILGKGKNEEITVQEMADIVGTSPYEVICNFNYKRMNYITK